MKITSIELTNFKAIGETVIIPVRPITLIFGANSAGKSSILQCLAMLAQSVNNGGSPLLGKGPLVDAGNYQNFSHEHNTATPFECKFNFDMNVQELFDHLLPDNIMSIRDLSLNDSAKKLKNILVPFKETSLSFCFRYDMLKKETFLDSIDFFLDANTKPVFSYNALNWNFQPNTDHIFWEMYWNIFKKEIYNKLYHYVRGMFESGLGFGGPNFEGWLTEKDVLFIENHLSRDHNHKSLIEIYCLLFPEEPFCIQLKEEAQQGGNELDLVFKLYTFEANEQENSSFETNHLTEFSGFLPSKFAYMKPGEFLCAEFVDNMHTTLDPADFFHPEQLMVLVASHVKYFLDSFSYLGPLRKKPERFHLAEDASKNSGNEDGDNIAHLLAKDDDLVCRVNLELDQLQTGYQIKIVHLTDSDGGVSGVFLLQFIDQKTGVAASIKDVGFGFSQILPVIVQCRRSSYRTVIIEQPELHLHPALQAELGDMFIRGKTERQFSQEEYDTMLTRLSSSESEIPNNWTNRHNRFFIETHSEHLILRLLRRIRENAEGELPENVPPITPDDIAVLYVQPGNNGAQVIHLPVTAEGEFATTWPGGFFAERARELF